MSVATTSTALACPSCQLPDRVQKVSAVASDSHSPMRRVLARPQQPAYASPWGDWSVPALGSLGLISCAAFGSAAGSNTAAQDALFVFGLIVLGIGIAIIARKVGESRQRQAWVEQETPVWQRAVGRWDQLYYCARCDGVFVPGSIQMTPSAQMSALLRKP